MSTEHESSSDLYIPLEELSMFDQCDSDDELTNVSSSDSAVSLGHDVIGQLYRCVVCQTLPFTKLCECPNGHIICAGCYQMRVLDKTLGTEQGTCSECQARIYRHSDRRNREGEDYLATLMVNCEDCCVPLQRCNLRYHAVTCCARRVSTCKYRRLGCKWKGVVGESVASHESNCLYEGKRGEHLLKDLKKLQGERDERQLVLAKMMRLLQLPNITVRLLHLLPQQEGLACTDYRVCNSFKAFSQTWSVRFEWQTTDIDATDPFPESEENSNCTLSFQLRLESMEGRRCPRGLTYSLVSGTYSEVHFMPNLCDKCDFTSEHACGPLIALYTNSWPNCHRLLTERGLYGRLLMTRK